MTTQTSLLNSERKLRKFSPVILFHDHQYIKAGSGDLEHIHIPYGDPRYLDVHKKRVHEMLETNGKYWLDFITYTRDHPEEHSPVPSLVSSPSPPYFDKKKTLPNNNAVSAANNKRRRGNLPKAVTAILRDWLSRHKKHPYPTEEEKAALAIETNLNLNQISNWFINARRRILQPMLEQEEEQQQAKHHLDIIMPYDHHLQDDRRLRKRSASEILSPTKYPPQKRMSPNPAMMNRRRS